MTLSMGMFMSVDLESMPERPVDVWFRAASTEVCPAGRLVPVRVGRRQVAVLHDSPGGRWYAFQDHCPRCGKSIR